VVGVLLVIAYVFFAELPWRVKATFSLNVVSVKGFGGLL
jgi:hypothetical protein